jgi:hypothetical protein
LESKILIFETYFYKMKKALLAIIVLLILCGYLYLSVPKKIVVNENGNAKGIVDKFRALLQGDKFWNMQLSMANEELGRINAPQKPSSAEMQVLYKKMREAERALDEKMKVLYSEDEEVALQLRIKADSLERSAKWKNIDDEAESQRMKELDRLKAIIPLIENRLHIPKQPTQNQ